jgi:hypothetical protein
MIESINNNKETGINLLGRRWIFSSLVRYGVLCTLSVSLVIFALYTAGSMPEVDFSDKTLFFLLQLLRYSSLLLCGFSLFAMGYSVQRLVNHPGVRNALSLFLYFITGMLGAGLAMVNSFIVAASEGNI